NAFALLAPRQVDVVRGFLAEIGVADFVQHGREVRAIRVTLFDVGHALRAREVDAQRLAIAQLTHESAREAEGVVVTCGEARRFLFLPLVAAAELRAPGAELALFDQEYSD